MSRPEEQGWQDIASAPKNRLWWVLWDEYYGQPVVVSKRSSKGQFFEGDWDREVPATLWFDVPEPPVQP